jgi:PAS domain S-box-containing protein
MAFLSRSSDPQPAKANRAGVPSLIWGAVISIAIFLALTVLLNLQVAALVFAAGSLCVAFFAHRRETAVAADLRRRLRDEESYQHFIETAIEGFFRSTREGRFVKANAALARIYGYDGPQQLLDEVGDIGITLYVDPHRRREFIALLNEKGQAQDFISEIRRRDGSKIWIAENARIVTDEHGEFMYYEGTVEDITAQRQSAELLRMALKEAEETARAKAAFLAAMSHELKTPLNAIIGFSDLMKQEVFGPINEPRYEAYVGHIHDNGKTLLTMIGDVLDLTRAEAGLLTLEEEEFSLDDILENTLPAVLAAADKDNPEVVRNLPEDLPLLRADRRRFRQVLLHVLSNAVKFTPVPGTITVGADVERDGSLRIWISDTGIGMPPERIAVALQPFRQLDSRLARRFDGVGVGLPLANALLRLHAATLEIHSTPGKGTVVTLGVPASRLIAPRLAETA